ncbi:MAG: MFS transporter [Hyphomicrobiales bacterium]|nr:MFS transporter [Hyphomicrobiales bacterium]
MTAADAAMTATDDALARRNAFVLAIAQALGGSSTTITFALGGLVGHYLADDKSLATLPVSCSVLGTAFATVGASWLTRHVGRRAGFVLGACIGISGSALAVYAILSASFWLFCAATVLTGAYHAFVQLYRFAAADTASEIFKPKAISWVLVGGVAAGVIGPQLVIFTRDLLAPVAFAGAFVAQGVIGLIAIGVLMLVRIPVPPKASVTGHGRPILEIMAQPRFVTAAICGIASYALMSLVMTAAPLAMIGCDHSVSDAALGIQWHVIAMFGPSFVTGHLINRFGKEVVMGSGLVLLAGCGVVALMGLELIHFWGALILLGVGWNFAFVGATAMVTDTYRPEERNKVQGTNDFLVFAFVAFASFTSGKMLDTVGWEVINMALFPITGLCLALLGWMTLRKSTQAS